MFISFHTRYNILNIVIRCSAVITKYYSTSESSATW
nr:MAG TPA: hypothetical protein [Caudoviricetes sp.]